MRGAAGMMRRAGVYRWGAVIVVAVLATGCSWTQVGFDSANTRNNPFEHLFVGAIDAESVTNLEHVWTAAVDPLPLPVPPAISAPIVDRGRVYVTSPRPSGQPSLLYAFNGVNGARLWSASLGENSLLLADPPVVSGDTIVTKYLGGLAGFDATGSRNCVGTAPSRVCEPVWRVTEVQLGGGLSAPFGLTRQPAVANGVVYVNMGFSYTVALRASDGAQLWVGQVPTATAFAGPSIANGKVFVVANAFPQRVVAYDEAGAQGCSDVAGTVRCVPVWQTLTGQGGSDAPTIANGRVFLADGSTFDATGAANCTGTTPITCTPLWTVNVGMPVVTENHTAYAIAGSELIVSPGSGARDRLYQVDGTGSQQCSGTPTVCGPVLEYLLDGVLPIGASPPAIANGVIYVGTQDGLRAFDADGVVGCSATLPVPTCQPLWRTNIAFGAAGPPSIVAGTVYVALGGNLHAYRLPAR